MSFSNPQKAIQYYEMAVKLGDSDAMNRLGELYEEGTSVPKNT